MTNIKSNNYNIFLNFFQHLQFKFFKLYIFTKYNGFSYFVIIQQNIILRNLEFFTIKNIIN